MHWKARIPLHTDQIRGLNRALGDESNHLANFVRLRRNTPNAIGGEIDLDVAFFYNVKGDFGKVETHYVTREEFGLLFDAIGRVYLPTTPAITKEKLQGIKKELVKVEDSMREVVIDCSPEGGLVRQAAQEIIKSLMIIRASLGLPTVDE